MPRFMVSAVPIIPMARSMLLQILAACRARQTRWQSMKIHEHVSMTTHVRQMIKMF